MLVRLASAALLAGVVLGLTACNGGTVDRHALENDSATLDSIACEGALLAHQVTSGGTTHLFTRVQANVLRVQASSFADALGSRDTVAGIEPRVRAKAREAARIAAALEELHAHSERPSTAESVERRLTKIGGGCA
jgi:predicted Zn-dependent peptidase